MKLSFLFRGKNGQSTLFSFAKAAKKSVTLKADSFSVQFCLKMTVAFPV